MYRFPLTVSHYFDDCDCFISFYAPFSLECVWSQTHSLGEVLERGCMVLLISSCSSVATYFKGAQNCAVIKVLIGEVNQLQNYLKKGLDFSKFSSAKMDAFQNVQRFFKKNFQYPFLDVPRYIIFFTLHREDPYVFVKLALKS